MPSWTGNRTENSGINGGQQYQSNDAIIASDINAVVNNAIYAANLSITATASGRSAGSAPTVSVTKTGGNSSNSFSIAFGIPKGDKGNTGNTGATGATGAAAGFGTVSATATGLAAGASPSVSVTADGANTAKNFAFSFGIPKGDKGDTGATGSTGAAAGFGTVSASASALSAGSNPTVSVSATGDNTAKNFAFSFGIPRGADGQNGQNGQDGQDGQDGADGRGITSIAKTSTSGLVDTYTITYTDNTTSTFTVTNGGGIVQSSLTLLANGWTLSNNIYTQSVTISSVGENDVLMVGGNSASDAKAMQEANIYYATASETTATFTAANLPSGNISIKYSIMRG